MSAQTGWQPIPMALKILSVVMVLWMVGSAMNLPNLMENGLPLLGNFVDGTFALLVVLALDIIGPLAFLYALWHRLPWAPIWASVYIGVFVLNGVVALFTVADQLGLVQILVPNAVNLAILAVIFWQSGYFRNSR